MPRRPTQQVRPGAIRDHSAGRARPTLTAQPCKPNDDRTNLSRVRCRI